MNTEIAKLRACLQDLGVDFDSVDDIYSKVALYAKRYEWLRDRMTLMDIPEDHPTWSISDEKESVKIDNEIDRRMNQQ